MSVVSTGKSLNWSGMFFDWDVMKVVCGDAIYSKLVLGAIQKIH